jgi:hypothetical protein
MGKNLFVYDGDSLFESTLTAFLSLNARNDAENYVFMSALSTERMAFLSSFGIRTSHVRDAENIYKIFNGQRYDDVFHLVAKGGNLRFVGHGPCADGPVAIIDTVALPFGAQVPTSVSAVHLAGCIRGKDEEIPLGQYAAVVTTNWRTCALSAMSGVPSILVVGPKPPVWLENIVRRGGIIGNLADKTKLNACPCLNTVRCHSSSLSKPCMERADWNSVCRVIANLLKAQ